MRHVICMPFWLQFVKYNENEWFQRWQRSQLQRINENILHSSLEQLFNNDDYCCVDLCRLWIFFILLCPSFFFSSSSFVNCNCEFSFPSFFPFSFFSHSIWLLIVSKIRFHMRTECANDETQTNMKMNKNDEANDEWFWSCFLAWPRQFLCLSMLAMLNACTMSSVCCVSCGFDRMAVQFVRVACIKCIRHISS